MGRQSITASGRRGFEVWQIPSTLAVYDELADGVVMLPSDQTPRAAIGVEPDHPADRANAFLANQGK